MAADCDLIILKNKKRKSSPKLQPLQVCIIQIIKLVLSSHMAKNSIIKEYLLRVILDALSSLSDGTKICQFTI